MPLAEYRVESVTDLSKFLVGELRKRNLSCPHCPAILARERVSHPFGLCANEEPDDTAG